MIEFQGLQQYLPGFLILMSEPFTVSLIS